jgi:hypothetical protein
MDAIDPLSGFAITAMICDKGSLLYAWYFASVQLALGDATFSTDAFWSLVK